MFFVCFIGHIKKQTPLPVSPFQTELPVPEQFKTVWDGSKLVTTATEIAG